MEHHELVEEITQLQSITKELDKRAARDSLLDFTRYTFPGYMESWHSNLLCEKLTAFANREIKYLIIELPPRHGKSEHVSRRLPAYLLGKYPDDEVVAASYSSDLANAMSMDVQRIMCDPLYAQLFPETKLAQSKKNITGRYKRTEKYFDIVDKRGSYKAIGVDGGLTGRGLNWGIIDDPIKNREEAESEVYQAKVYEFFLSTFYTRMEKMASLLVTATRWHENDLIGKILDSKSGHLWEVLTLKAIKEDDDNPYDNRAVGEALWPGKYNDERLAEIKDVIKSRNFASLYQQSPSAAEGNIFKREWWQFYDELPMGYNTIIHSWDTDFGKKAAESAGLFGKLYANGLYLTDMFADSLEFPQLDNQIRIKYAADKAHAVLIEDKASGQSLIQVLKQQTVIPVIPVSPTSDKVSRAYAASPFVESGNVYLPRNAPWTDKFIDICSSFPNAKLKDVVDALTQMIDYARLISTGKPAVSSAPRKMRIVKGF